MGKTEHRVSVDNGKYTFVSTEGYRIHVLRHGEPWIEHADAPKAIHSMMCELDAARVVVQAARDAVDAPTLRRKELLQEALRLHDRLVSDREPPSAWCGAVPVAQAKYSCTVEHYTAHIALHTEWSAAVGTPGYDKSTWKERDRQLHAHCRGGCLVNPPPLATEPTP